MSERPPRQPSGQLSIGDGSGPEYNPYETRRNLGGGGSSRWMAMVIAGLVLATGISLLLLRNYELNKEARAEAAAQARQPTPAAPASAPAPSPVMAPVPAAPAASATPSGKAGPSAAAPAVTDVKPAAPAAAEVKGAKPAAPAAPPEAPRVTPLPSEKPAAVKPRAEVKSAKPKSKPHRERSDSGARALPRLPTPPPVDPAP